MKQYLRSARRFAAVLIAIGSAGTAGRAAPEVVLTLDGPKPADTIHHLVELDSRRRIKPYDLLHTVSGEYPSERLVFRDSLTGTLIWKMSRNPGYNLHAYSNIPAWNCDGSEMLLSSRRPEAAQIWRVAPDGSRWTPLGHGAAGWVYWSGLDPHQVVYETRRHVILQCDVTTGEIRQLWDLSGEKGDLKLFRPSADGKKFLVRQMHIPVGGETHSFALILNADGTGQPQRIDLGREAGQMWFLKRSDYSFTFDAESGDERYQWVCEPEKNGAIHVLAPWQFYHVGVSPAGTRAAYGRDRPSGLWITDVETGASRACVPFGRQIARIGGDHFSWECDDRWLVGSMGNAIYEVQVDSDRTRLICVPNTQHSARAESEPESSPDGTKFVYDSTMMGDDDAYVAVQRLPDPPRNVRLEGRVLTWDPPERCRELAGYCVYRGSELLNREPFRECRYEVPAEEGSYTVVAVEWSGLQSPCPDREAPPPPTGLVATPRSPFVMELSWRPSPAPDVSYYNVYCSTRPQPAARQENRVASPTEPHLIDWGLQAGTSYTYTLTAVDRAGNESEPSAPLTVQTPAINRVLQRIPVGQSLGRTPLEVPLDVPSDGRYLLWVELKASKVAPQQQIVVALDGARRVAVQPTWDYVAIGHDEPASTPFFDTLKSDGACNPWYRLAAGLHRLALILPRGSAEVVSLTLTNDAGFLPDGITRFRAR